MPNKLNMKTIVSDIKSFVVEKMKDIKLLDAEHKKLLREIKALKKTALYGRIININKYQQPCVNNDFQKTIVNVYRQFVAKRENGKQQKVYLGTDFTKEQECQQRIDDGQMLISKLKRLNEIEENLIEFYGRINGQYL